ncbi:MAG: RNA 2',3'-cyclic phosphodiesterase [Terriglobales bacterium]
MRTFVALEINDSIRERIQLFMEGVRGFAPEARWVRHESLHVTLKFIGEKSADPVEQIKQSLSGIRAEPFDLTFRGYGFFPTPKAARVFWIGIEAQTPLVKLAAAVDEATAALGIPREAHLFNPHLTLARGGNRSGAPSWRKGDATNQNFRMLQEKLAKLPTPEFGTMATREFFLYESQLMRGGSRYSKIARFALNADYTDLGYETVECPRCREHKAVKQQGRVICICGYNETVGRWALDLDKAFGGPF